MELSGVMGSSLGSAQTIYRFSVEKAKKDADRDPAFQERNWSRIREGQERAQRTLLMRNHVELISAAASFVDAPSVDAVSGAAVSAIISSGILPAAIEMCDQLAIEAIVMQVLRPLLEAVQPGVAAEVIEVIRAGLNVPAQNEVQRLAAEEYLQRFADDIERRVRAKIGAPR